MSADLKPSLIDLEATTMATGRKQVEAVHRERLSERATTNATRVCATCGQPKPIADFAYRGGDRVGIQSTCKPCSLERLRAHRREMRERVTAYKLDLGCALCGYNSHPAALHLDHREPSTKRNRGKASRALEVSWSWKRIQDELAKCQVLCANCHAVKTHDAGDHLYR